MKKILLFFALFIVTLTTGAQNIKTLTFEDLGSSTYWSNLIDNPQYFGPLLYSQDPNYIYQWCDSTTRLRSAIPKNYNQHWFWGGGHAISDYWSGILSRGNYQNQLEVYVSGNNSYGRGGHGAGNSNHFAVHFGYVDGSQFNMTDTLPYIEFYDNVPRTIMDMQVNINTYLANCLINGNSLTSKLGPNDYVTIVATGYYNGEEVGSVYKDLARGSYILNNWATWDLHTLEECSRVEFNVTGSNDNGYGFSQPAYFCYDDVRVDFGTENESNQNMVKAKAQVSAQAENLTFKITPNNKTTGWISGDVPEGCSVSYESDKNRSFKLMNTGNYLKINVCGLPTNTKINSIKLLGNCDGFDGSATVTASIGETEISHFDFGGTDANHGLVVNSDTSITLDMPLNDCYPVVGENDFVIYFTCQNKWASIDYYEISYTIDDPTGINDVKNNVEETNPQIFTIDGRQVRSTTTPGLYIINGKKTFVK